VVFTSVFKGLSNEPLIKQIGESWLSKSKFGKF